MKVSARAFSLTLQIVASMMDLPYVVLHREDVITTFSVRIPIER